MGMNETTFTPDPVDMWPLIRTVMLSVFGFLCALCDERLRQKVMQFLNGGKGKPFFGLLFTARAWPRPLVGLALCAILRFGTTHNSPLPRLRNNLIYHTTRCKPVQSINMTEYS